MKPIAKPARRHAMKGPTRRKLAAFRLPPKTLAKIKAGARSHGYSQADFIRDCVDLFPGAK